eukprot:g1352.t1
MEESKTPDTTEKITEPGNQQNSNVSVVIHYSGSRKIQEKVNNATQSTHGMIANSARRVIRQLGGIEESIMQSTQVINEDCFQKIRDINSILQKAKYKGKGALLNMVGNDKDTNSES